ncbi:hypothetical protein FOLKNPGA_02747 [Legionella sp. PC1000]|nr:hypothetical protein FOLKNPGA_02747 [Legionella sp. PC1000]
MGSENEVLVERGLLTASDDQWESACLRTEIIAPLAKLETVTWALADEAADTLGISGRQVYTLIKRYRQGNGLVSDMLLNKSYGGKGKSRLPETIEQIIREVLRSHYLNKQKYSETVVWNEIVRQCRKLNLSVPARNTVRLRIQWLDPYVVTRKRNGVDAAKTLESAGGVPPKILSPLEQVQIDHTVIDLMIVDDINRQPIGRPYITIVIDVFSRCVIGMLVTLEAPSAVSVGLCLAHAVCDKRPWLERLGVDIDWSMSGKPLLLYLDNGAEFKSEALRRGCEQHGIVLNYRPPGKTHYGGIIERLIGTVMQRVHELPGTTFSNLLQKSDYNSEAKAVLTLQELERWVALAIGHYHATVHHTLNQIPSAVWAEGMIGCGKVHTVSNPRAFLIDFLPVIRRRIGRSGFLIDHITYYSDILKSWIANRNNLEKFIIRRNPLDLSRIWVLDPNSNQYIEIPYRILSRPSITLWEHKQAMAQLRARGQSQVDETMLFRMVSQMREIVKSAQSSTRKARRKSATA